MKRTAKFRGNNRIMGDEGDEVMIRRVASIAIGARPDQEINKLLWQLESAGVIFQYHCKSKYHVSIHEVKLGSQRGNTALYHTDSYSRNRDICRL